MDPTNAASTLFKLFEKAQPSEFNWVTHNLLNTIVANRKIFDKSINDNQYSILKGQFDTSIAYFDNLEVDEPFQEDSNTVNETLTNSQSQSNSTGATSLPVLNVLTPNETNGSINNVSETSQDNLNSQLMVFLTEKFKEFKQEMDVKFENLNNKNDNYENKSFAQLSKLLNFRIRKRLLANHAINIQKEHKKNGTAPSQIQADKFFHPYSFTTRFLTKMDEIIKTVQLLIIDAIIEEIELKIEYLDNDIEKIKKALEKHKKKDEISKLAEDSVQNETKKLKKRFNNSLNKTKKPNVSFLVLYENQIVDDDAISEYSDVSNITALSSITNKSHNDSKKSDSFRLSRKSFNQSNQRNENYETKPKSILRNNNSRSNSRKRNSSINRTSTPRQNNQNNQQKGNINQQNRYSRNHNIFCHRNPIS